MSADPRPATAPRKRSGVQSPRARWMKQLYRWHWISSALCLVGMLGFAVTGITLNHAASIESRATVSQRHAELPPDLVTRLQGLASRAHDDTPLPDDVRAWLGEALDRDIPARAAEWSAEEVYLSLPRPGGDAWLAIDLAAGNVEYELSDRGLVSWLNDLHKGRNTGTAWSWFIDLFSVACIVFTVTGLLILQLHAKNRPMVWPTVGLGALIPLVLILFFLH